jgi:hypothetical protein
MARIQTHSQPSRAAGRVQQFGQLLERAAQRAARAGGVLEVKRAPVGLGQRLLDHLPGPRDRLTDIAVLGRPRMEHDRHGADALANAQRMDQRGQRLLPDLGILRAAVEQVDGVDQDRLDRAVGTGIAKGAEVVLAVRGRPPHARRLVEDLNRLAPALDAPLDRSCE